jgi:hypothetical protein
MLTRINRLYAMKKMVPGTLLSRRGLHGFINSNAKCLDHFTHPFFISRNCFYTIGYFVFIYSLKQHGAVDIFKLHAILRHRNSNSFFKEYNSDLNKT